MAARFSILGRAKSFRYAFAGLWFMLRTQHNAWIHLAATIIVVAAAFVLQVSAADWRWLIAATLLVWVAETLNTAFEHLCDVVSPDFHHAVQKSKDIAAGAVLICAAGAVAIGVVTFWPYVSAQTRGSCCQEQLTSWRKVPSVARRAGRLGRWCWGAGRGGQGGDGVARRRCVSGIACTHNLRVSLLQGPELVVSSCLKSKQPQPHSNLPRPTHQVSSCMRGILRPVVPHCCVLESPSPTQPKDVRFHSSAQTQGKWCQEQLTSWRQVGRGRQAGSGLGRCWCWEVGRGRARPGWCRMLAVCRRQRLHTHLRVSPSSQGPELGVLSSVM